MESIVNGDWCQIVTENAGAIGGRCVRLACTRRIVPRLADQADQEGMLAVADPNDAIAYWRGSIDARILLVDRVLQDMQAQIRQMTERMEAMQEMLRQDMQVSTAEARAGNRWTYMIVGGGILLASLLPFLLPLMGQGKRP